MTRRPPASSSKIRDTETQHEPGTHSIEADPLAAEAVSGLRRIFRTHLRRRPPAWLLFFGVAVITTLLFVVSHSSVVKLTLQVCVCVATTMLLGTGWWKQRAQATDGDPMIGLAFLAMVSYTVAVTGFATWPVALGLTLPVPSPVDALFFLSYGLFAVLLWRLGSRSQTSDPRQYLDTLIVVLGAMPVVWVRLVEPQLDAGPASVVQLTYLAYPVFVSVLLGLTIRLALRAHRFSVPYVLLGGWIGFELAGDLVQLEAGVAGTYIYGQPWQAMWVLSAGCLGALVLHPRARDMLKVRRSPAVQGRNRLYILGGALAGPMITLAVADEMSERADRFCVAVGLVLIVAVCLRLAGLMVDVKEQRRSQAELRRLSATLSHTAMHDPLTGLANRVLLNERLAHALSGGVDAPTSVLLLDVDDFKLVNDSLGHAVGDLLLVEVASRIELELRTDDRAGRLGGDEFVVVLDHADAVQAQVLAERLLLSLAQPMLLGDVEVSVSVSIGIATSEDVCDGLNLLGAADMAMYDAKQRGKAGSAMFVPQMQQAAKQRLTLEIDLRRALRNDELFLAYQPIVDLKTGTLVGVEALVRWHDPRHGAVSPELFIPIAERTGLILPLGEWVLRESVAQMNRWDQRAPQSRLVVNVNVSTRQLERPGLLAVVDELIAEGLDPTRLVLEITETALTLDGEAAAASLHQLRARGVRLAVDDFGTGYSSLSRLQGAPVSQLKIDRSFVAEIQNPSTLVPIIHATVAMADGLGLAVIAEGVETADQLQYLRRLGCAYAQGYLLARPQDAGSITNLLCGPLPWLALLAAADADQRHPQPRRASETASEPDTGAGPDSPGRRALQPSDVVQAAQAIAALAAAEVAADAAITAQAAVTAACAAALQAAEKAERVAALASDAAAEAARLLAAGSSRPLPQDLWDTATPVSELVGGEYTAEEAARDVAVSRTARAAASAVLKVAAQVQSVAAAAAAAGASAAGLIELQLAEDAVVAASTIARTTPHLAVVGGNPTAPQRGAACDATTSGDGDVTPAAGNDLPGVSPDTEQMIDEMKLSGASASTIAARLNHLRERTPRGVRWHATSVEAAHLLSLKRRAGGT